MAKTKRTWTLEHTFPWILTIGGAIGFIASFALAFDKVKLAANPSYVPSCNFNPIVSCGTVIKTWQSSAFGFPNAFIGVGGFAIVTTVGMMLLAGLNSGQLKRWFWRSLNVASLLAVVFIGWLISQTLYVIHALCPWCMVVWTVTFPIFWYTTLYNLRNGFVPTPRRLKRVVAFMQKHHGDILIIIYLVIITMILDQFWYYWKTLI